MAAASDFAAYKAPCISPCSASLALLLLMADTVGRLSCVKHVKAAPMTKVLFVVAKA